jgi:hypothetical protein
MRDLTQGGGIATNPNVPKGFAFEIADLLLASSWACFHEIKMVIRLDHGTDEEEYEEVIELDTGLSSFSRLIVWRGVEAVFVQPILGRKHKFNSVAEALNGLHSNECVVPTDIIAMAWPIA